MNTEVIDKLFNQVINERAVHLRLKHCSSAAIRNLRYRQKGKLCPVSHKKKIQVLQLAGVKLEHYEYTQKDMVNFLKFYNNTSQAARDLGIEYVLQKWSLGRNQLILL